MQPKPQMYHELLDGSDNPESNDGSYKTPEELADIFSRSTLAWMTPMITKGTKQSLVFEDIPRLSKERSPSVVSAKFQRNWQDEVNSGQPSLIRAILRTYWVNIALR
ncbi:hypothetical protein LPJ75_005236, partial [Coemansia sp. RSA 2598]